MVLNYFFKIEKRNNGIDKIAHIIVSHSKTGSKYIKSIAAIKAKPMNAKIENIFFIDILLLPALCSYAAISRMNMFTNCFIFLIMRSPIDFA